MLKKISVFLAVVLVVVFSFPHVSVRAAEGDPDLKLYTLESIDGFFEGGFTGSNNITYVWQDIADQIYNNSNEFFTENILSGLSSLPADPNNHNSSPLSSGVFFITRDNSNNLTVYWPLEIYNNVTYDWQSSYNVLLRGYDNRISFYSNCDAGSVQYYMMQSTLNPSTGTWSSPIGYTMTSLSYGVEVFRVSGTSQTVIVSCSDGLPIYDAVNYYRWHTTEGTVTPSLATVFYDTTVEDYTNLHPADLPYYNGSEIITPDGGDSSEVESNENHMYFKSCDIGFAEPSGVNSYNSFGGAYFYIKYSVDDWVRTHINDYDLYFSSTALVGSRQVNGSKRVSLDSDGCICIPFSDIFSGNSSLLSEGFVVATSNSRVEQNFYKSYLYSVSSEKLPSLVGKFSSVDNNTLSGAWDKLLDVYFGNWLLAYTSSGFTNVITDSTMAAIQSVITYYANFKIQTQCYLIDNNDNRSGSVGRIFDLATGSDTSTDNEGLTNDNPYVDDSTNDDYLPDIPSENTYPVSTGQNGTYIQNNLSIPSSYTVTYRDGVNEFIDWYNQDSSVTGIQNTVWGAFGVFRDNPATDLYQEYFGFLPEPFKQVIFGCGTIGIVGGAACVLRKRLMK